jgi:NAD+ synthase (glutamine-hydrolysing)
VKEEEFTRSVTLGLFDYVRKSRSRGVVISLSGGADSAACTVLASLMLKLAEQQIGLEGIRERLSYCALIQTANSYGDLAKQIITTVYQSTDNSSDTTRNAARDVAKVASSTHLEFDVAGLVKDYSKMVADAIGRPLDWRTDDIAMQNIQARVRSPGIWMLANIFGSLLISTSNRSEAAVGYTTMDGDSSGGLAPIAGIDKAFLRDWLSWMETQGPAGLRPTPELKSINVQQPTAELRPPDQKQTDEDDLMPYPVLDRIERLAIRDKHTPSEVLIRLRAEYGDQDDATLICWTKRFFRLWSRNQWKRERYAPSFHLDDENLDPKTWCRFPILSGGFEDELKALK